MKHVRSYITGLNAIIAAGVDVRFFYEGHWIPAICVIEINEEEKCLEIWSRTQTSIYDFKVNMSVRTHFTMEFNDLPNDLRKDNWL